MALVIEFLGRSGRSQQFIKIEAESVSIGRGYQNDVVINDPYISINHLRLEKRDEGWRLNDLDSLNGVEVLKAVGEDKSILASGSEIKLGRTKLRLVSDQSLMQEAKLLHRLERDTSRLNQWSIFLPLLVALMGFGLYSSYMNSFVQWEWKNILSLVLTMQLGTLLVAGFWALLGRFALLANPINPTAIPAYRPLLACRPKTPKMPTLALQVLFSYPPLLTLTRSHPSQKGA